MKNKYVDIATYSKDFSMIGNISFVLEDDGDNLLVCIIDTKTGTFYRVKLQDFSEALNRLNNHAKSIHSGV